MVREKDLTQRYKPKNRKRGRQNVVETPEGKRISREFTSEEAENVVVEIRIRD